jgi:hypothetical protein
MLITPELPAHAGDDQRARFAGFLTSPLGGLLVLTSLLSAPLLTGFIGWLALELAPTVLRLPG